MSEQVDDDSGDDAIDDYFFNDDDDFAYDQSNEDEPQFGSVDRDLVSERFKSPMSRFEESMAHAFAQDAADDLEDAKSEFIRRLTLPATGHDPEFEDDGEFEEQIQYHIMDRMTGSGLTMMAHAASSNDVPFMQSLLNARVVAGSRRRPIRTTIRPTRLRSGTPSIAITRTSRCCWWSAAPT
jgi:hypothetical protein